MLQFAVDKLIDVVLGRRMFVELHDPSKVCRVGGIGGVELMKNGEIAYRVGLGGHSGMHAARLHLSGRECKLGVFHRHIGILICLAVAMRLKIDGGEVVVGHAPLVGCIHQRGVLAGGKVEFQRVHPHHGVLVAREIDASVDKQGVKDYYSLGVFFLPARLDASLLVRETVEGVAA